MVDHACALVEEDSPSTDVLALTRCSAVVTELGVALTGRAPEQIDGAQSRPHLRWRFGSRPRVLLLGHFDTVWPTGTAADWPPEIKDGVLTGPGVFDMKAGIVQLFFAVSELDDLDGISILLTSDEEIGSPTSHDLIEQEARDMAPVLVLEPSADGALKTERKGGASYELRVVGRAAHAGLDPEKGFNAVAEVAHQIVRISDLSEPGNDTSVTPTLLSGGVTSNTVPGTAAVHIDVRARTSDELERIHQELSSLKPVVDGCRLNLIQHHRRAPLEKSVSSQLFEMARKAADALGLPPLEGAAVGGGSDGNRTAALGVPTLDGLGAVGGKAHAQGEFIYVDAMAQRAALVCKLITELRATG